MRQQARVDGITIAGVNQVLTVYTWFPLAALLAILLMIGRFYQRQTGEKTRFMLFALPIVLFGLAAARYATESQIQGDGWGDGLMFVAGVTSIVLCVNLYRRMTGGR